MLSSVELEAKFIAKIFNLSDADEMTSGPLMMEGTAGMPLKKILFEIYENLQEPSFLFSTLAWTALA